MARWQTLLVVVRAVGVPTARVPDQQLGCADHALLPVADAEVSWAEDLPVALIVRSLPPTVIPQLHIALAAAEALWVVPRALARCEAVLATIESNEAFFALERRGRGCQHLGAAISLGIGTPRPLLIQVIAAAAARNFLGRRVCCDSPHFFDHCSGRADVRALDPAFRKAC